jgi:hypothetical protein
MPSVVPLFHAMKPGRTVRLTRRISRGNPPDDARKAAEEALELARRYGERGNETEALRSSANVPRPPPGLISLLRARLSSRP